jgi:dephospho-CoA kinase
MLVVGLTGGIASGKSIVSEAFRKLGVAIIDADLIARELVKPSTPGYKEILEHFGQGILNPDKTINRQRLAKIIFDNEREREKLNSLLHPRVVNEIKRRIEDLKGKGEKTVIVDAALLIEAGEISLVDKLIVVTVSPKTQLRRLMERDHLTAKEAKERIAAQLPLTEKIKLADFIIDNSASVRKTIKRTKEIYLTITAEKE